MNTHAQRLTTLKKVGIISDNCPSLLWHKFGSQQIRDRVAGFLDGFKENKAKVVICPVPGLSLHILPLLAMKEVPFSIVIPSKKFFGTYAPNTELLLAAGVANATHVHILTAEETSVTKWTKHLNSALQHVVDTTDAVFYFATDLSLLKMVHELKTNGKKIFVVVLGLAD